MLNSPPDRIWVMDLLIDGFSATHRYLTICAARSAPAPVVQQHRPTSVYRASTRSHRFQRSVSGRPQTQKYSCRGVWSAQARRGRWGHESARDVAANF